jgi:hypothetical protein
MILSASNFLDYMVSTMCRPRPLRASHQLVRALYSIRAKVRSLLTVVVGAVASTGADVAPMVAASADDGDGDGDPEPGSHLAGLPAPAMRFCATLFAGMAS